MRLFVALNLPARERKRIHKAAGSLRERDLPVRWVGPEHYHLTLKFLGTVRAEKVDEVIRTVSEVAASTGFFDLEIGGFGAFPTIRRPRVLWLGIEASPALRCLKQDLEWALAECGFDRETRAFHPHLTLGRADESGGAGEFRGLDDVVAAMDYEGRVPVKALDLMSSKLSREGPRYTVVSSSRLGTDT